MRKRTRPPAGAAARRTSEFRYSLFVKGRGDDAWHLLEEHDSLMQLRDVAKLIEQAEEVWAIVDNRTSGIARCEALRDEAAQKKNRPAATGRFQERSKDMTRPLPRL